LLGWSFFFVECQINFFEFNHIVYKSCIATQSIDHNGILKKNKKNKNEKTKKRTLPTIYEAQTLLLNGVSVSDTRISVDTCRTLISVDTRRTLLSEVFNSKNIYWIFENSNTVLTQF